jgi:DNA-binding NarL/FixJ family response regulator
MMNDELLDAVLQALKDHDGSDAWVCRCINAASEDDLHEAIERAAAMHRVWPQDIRRIMATGRS